MIIKKVILKIKKKKSYGDEDKKLHKKQNNIVCEEGKLNVHINIDITQR